MKIFESLKKIVFPFDVQMIAEYRPLPSISSRTLDKARGVTLNQTCHVLAVSSSACVGRLCRAALRDRAKAGDPWGLLQLALVLERADKEEAAEAKAARVEPPMPVMPRRDICAPYR